MEDVLGHPCVDLACQFDEARVLSVLAGFPGEIKWIDWDAVAAKAGAGIKRHEPKRLSLRCFYDFPDVDSHGAVNQFEFVNQRDIDTPENIFEQLRSFSHATRRYRDQRVDRASIELRRPLKASRSVTGHNFRNL